MKKGKHILAGLLCLVLLAGCGAAVSEAAGPQEPRGRQIHPNRDLASGSLAQGVHAGVLPAGPQLPEPPQPAGQRHLPQQGIGGQKLLPDFEAAGYTVVTIAYPARVGDCAYGSEGLFFVFGGSLYYADSTGIYLQRQDVGRIAGLYGNGLLISPPREWNEGNGSLLVYNPADGTATSLLEDVHGALLSPNNEDLLYYARWVPDDTVKEGGRFHILRRNLATGEEALLFEDDLVDSTSYMGEGPNAAMVVYFFLSGQGLYAELGYPYGSEFFYERCLRLEDGADSPTQDSELAAVPLGNMGVYQNAYFPVERIFELNGFEAVRTLATDAGPVNLTIVKNGQELRWLEGENSQPLAAEGLLYVGRSYGEIYVTDGSYGYRMRFPGDAGVQLQQAGGHLVFVAEYAAESEQSYGGYSYYVGAPTPENPGNIRFVGAVSDLGEDQWGENGYLASGPGLYAAGHFIIHDIIGGPNPTLVVLNVETGVFATAGAPGLELMLPQ